MKKRVLFIISVFLFFLVVFLLFKSIFTIAYASMGGGFSVSDLLLVLYHGLPLDFSMSGYLTALPALLTITSLWVKPSVIKKILSVYFGIIVVLLTLIFIADLAIYPFWGFHFDSSIFLYLTSPIDSLASATALQLVVGLVTFVVFSLLIWFGYERILGKQVRNFDMLPAKKTVLSGIVLLLLTGFLFLPIRGGVSVSTMNIGKAYFSDNMFLNHAAINPHFNLMYSLSKSEDFGSQYQFYHRDEANSIFSDLMKRSENGTTKLLKTDKPNIILFILESFSEVVAMDSMISPTMVRESKEGGSFSNFFANSYRTDRGLVSVLSGYPAHPTVALMKYPQKTQSLPTIPKKLIENGYNSSFYYGGDLDFANMRSYIVGACGTSAVCSDVDFPLNQRLTKWGVPDAYLLEKVYDDYMIDNREEPSLTTVLTLSSHEPFDVPNHAIGDPFLDAVNYTDEHLGIFIEKLKKTDKWDNTLIILLADHCMQSYPENVNHYDALRYQIPMVWTGGAVNEHFEISDYGSQNDLASTLLGQLGIDYSDFRFSHNMLNIEEPKFAFYSYNNGFSMADSTGVVIYDNGAEKLLKQEGSAELEKKAKAFFQTMYIDLGDR